MSLWVDKYRPKDFSKLDFHKEQATNLKNLVQQSDFPHLLVYGPSGAGKKTRIMCMLRELYGPGVERLRQETMSFTTPSNKKIELMSVSSNYHIEVNPTDVGVQDRVVIMELVKKVAQTHQIDSSGQREFKVIILNEVDGLTKDAQHGLRRTMEKYIQTCRIILVANSISRVIPAIRSRCLAVRVPAPTLEEISSVLHSVCKKEGLVLPPEFAMKIAKCSDRNLRRAILMCEASKVQKYPFTPDQKVPEPDWQVVIRDTGRMIIQQQTPQRLYEVRQKLYELLIHGIPADMIFIGLLKELIDNCDIEMKSKVASLAATYEHRMKLGSKSIFHIEAFIAKFMSIYKVYMESFNVEM